MGGDASDRSKNGVYGSVLESTFRSNNASSNSVLNYNFQVGNSSFNSTHHTKEEFQLYSQIRSTRAIQSNHLQPQPDIRKQEANCLNPTLMLKRKSQDSNYDLDLNLSLRPAPKIHNHHHHSHSKEADSEIDSSLSLSLCSSSPSSKLSRLKDGNDCMKYVERASTLDLTL